MADEIDEGSEQDERHGLVDGLFDLARVVAVAIAVALAIRILLLQPFNIPSGSMIPSLLVGDYLFVTKYNYGYSRYSLPFRPPLFKGRLFGREPERGDVVVFHTKGIDYIKRLIGLPGDTVQMRNGRLELNGQSLPRQLLEPFLTRDLYGYEREVRRYRETLPNGVSYETLDLINDGAGDNSPLFRVPDGAYFMLGDNRDNSSDSRFNAPIGFVPHENLIGKAQFLYFSRVEPVEGHQPPPDNGQIRWRRLLKRVR